MNFEEIVKSIQTQIPDVNITILKFIHDILNHCEPESEQNEGVYKLFASGYCYYFAKILQTAFPGGTIVWCAPYGHIAYRYQNVIYDAHYVYDGEAVLFIPVNNMGDTIQDFLHIPNIAHNTTQEEITQMILQAKQDPYCMITEPISPYHITWLSKPMKQDEGYKFKIHICQYHEIAATLYLTNQNQILMDIKDQNIPDEIIKQAKKQLQTAMTQQS